MNEERFRQELASGGYGEAQFKDFEPGLDGPLHTHDFSVRLMVVSGEFTLAGEDGSKTFRPGEICELSAGVPHAEHTGPAGARVLLGKK